MPESNAPDYLHELATDTAFNDLPHVSVHRLPLPEHECEHGSLPGDLLAVCACWARAQAGQS